MILNTAIIGDVTWVHGRCMDWQVRAHRSGTITDYNLCIDWQVDVQLRATGQIHLIVT